MNAPRETIAALDKAEALARHRTYLGSPLEGWLVPLTHAEAVELLNWFVAHPDYPLQFQEDLRLMRNEPFRAFEVTQIRLVGFPVGRLQ